jgi:thiopurine S-methyltransferase
MEQDFWRRRWREGLIGWHQPAAHPMLLKHLPTLGVGPGARIFVPMCGKTLDIHWLLQAGYRVVGAELVESAVEELFSELCVRPAVAELGSLKSYGAERIDVFVGDLFDLTRQTLGPVDATYDRAALVALPAPTRPAYAAHISEITARAPQLLITFDYDQTQMDGPPFSVPGEEVRALYADAYDAAPLESAEVAGGGLKGFCPATEVAWALRATG